MVLLRHPIIALVVTMASLRLAWLYKGLPLESLIPKLRTVRSLPSPLRRLDLYLPVMEILLRWLPPRGLRPCLKRSLLLLDLGTRCGLSVRFHLGARSPYGQADGHAWVSADGDESFLTPKEEDFAEIYSA